MGWNFPYPFYNRDVELIPGQPNPCRLLNPTQKSFNTSQQKICDFENMLEGSFHCYLSWSLIPESAPTGSIQIQLNHLDYLAQRWELLKSTTRSNPTFYDSRYHIKGDLESYGVGTGCASGGWTPDGYFFDLSGRLRGVMEAKSSLETPHSSLRQGVASAINIAYSLIDHGVDPWDVVVPIVSSNGFLFQFACVALLSPCFPVVIPMSHVLDLGVRSQRTLVAQYLLSIDEFLRLPLGKYRDAYVNVERGLDLTIYHRKYVRDFYNPQAYTHQGLFSSFQTLNKAYSTPCSQFIVYPLCVREKGYDDDASLIFINICTSAYQIGVPADPHLQQFFIEELKSVIESIHQSGFVHLDLYPSNIMWKYDENNVMSIRLIDWDSIHEIGKKYDSRTQEILSRKKGNFNINLSEVSTEWDVAHFNLIKSNLHSFISTDKAKLDETFEILE
jgi:hypothetical protein